MSPEALRGESVALSADVYSAGVVLWELVAKAKPWTGVGPLQVPGMVGYGGRRLEVPQGVAPAMRVLIESCFRDAAKRPSFDAMWDQLQALICEGGGEQAAIPPEFMCPITMEIMADPVVAADGFTYERSAIETWLRNHATSPKTNVQMADNNLVANTTLKVMIQDHMDGD
jgi:hypothetical protein